jgi:MFS family permease
VLRLFPALAAPDFRLLWFSVLPSMLGIQMAAVTIGFAAFALSGSATVLGGVSIATGLPMLLLSLVGGVVADRAARRTVLIGTQGALGLSAGVTAALAMTGNLAVWHLYLLGLAQGMAFAFNMPARQAFIAELVRPEHLRSAVTLNNAGMNFTRIAGPSVAGGLLALPVVGIGGVFATTTALFAAAMAALLRLPPHGADERSGARGGWAQLVAGLTHIRYRPALLALLTLGFIPLFFGMPIQTLLPLFADRVYGMGAVGLGLMSAAIGAGALAGSLMVALWAREGRLGPLQLMCGVGFGLALLGFGLSPTFPIAVALLAVVGFTSAGYASANQTLVMEHTDPPFHGRVNSVYLLSFGLMPVAAFPEAWLADHIGGPTTMVAAGAAVISGVLLAALCVPSYRRLR